MFVKPIKNFPPFTHFPSRPHFRFRCQTVETTYSTYKNVFFFYASTQWWEINNVRRNAQNNIRDKSSNRTKCLTFLFRLVIGWRGNFNGHTILVCIYRKTRSRGFCYPARHLHIIIDCVCVCVWGRIYTKWMMNLWQATIINLVALWNACIYS